MNLRSWLSYQAFLLPKRGALFVARAHRFYRDVRCGLAWGRAFK